MLAFRSRLSRKAKGLKASAVKAARNVNRRQLASQLLAVFIMAFVFATVLAPAMPAAAQSVELSIDIDPLFEAINSYLPVFFTLFAVAGGIGIAVIIVKFVINAIMDAFKGNKL